MAVLFAPLAFVVLICYQVPNVNRKLGGILGGLANRAR